MRVKDRLGLARALIDRFAPEVRAKGVYTPPTGLQPVWRVLKRGELELLLCENVLMMPTDAVTSELMDVRYGRRKVFSVWWKTQQPWLPPEVVCCKAGFWMHDLRLEEFLQTESASKVRPQSG